MKGLKVLAQLDYNRKRDLYKSIPDHAIPRSSFSDSTASGLTKSILVWLDIHHHKAFRQPSEGRYRPGEIVTDVIGRQRQMKGTYIPGLNNGHADITAIINGKFVAWEIKIGKDRQSQKQKQFQIDVEQSGGMYFIVRSFEEFLEQYRRAIEIKR